MKSIKESIFVGERAGFGSKNLSFENCTFKDGESQLKHSENIEISASNFGWKYPLWYCKNFTLTNSIFLQTARSGVWYSSEASFSGCLIEAPKTFRRSQKIKLTECNLPNADETLWSCDEVRLKNVQIKGDYFGKDSQNIEADHIQISGNYAFDGGKNISVTNSTLISKDAFWNCENVSLENCVIIGEYFGWNSKNLTLKNCTLQSEQGLCYIQNLVMRDCKLLDTTLCFEYSADINAQISSSIASVKNPLSGKISAQKIDELILEADKIDPSKTKITTKD